ncbi:MAG: shikimate kinase [Cyanobacteria bacterium REEB459]|nr:shikimate kinase [Cyanobacteria bacterium REEB459]
MSPTTIALRQRLQGLNLYLIGMMGAGKSTTGQGLAQALEYQFFDTDTLAEQVSGEAIANIFQQQGETAFRQLETEVLAQLSAYQGLVVATGGGIVTQPANWSYLHHGVVIWLDVPLPLLHQRLQGDQSRPLLHQPDWFATLAHLLEQRQPLYAQADVRVTVQPEDSVEAIVNRILRLVDESIRPDRFHGTELIH